MSINGTPLKRSRAQLSGVVFDPNSGEDNTQQFSNRNNDAQVIPDFRNRSRGTTPGMMITPLGRRLGSNSKERPNFKSIQQAQLNPKGNEKWLAFN